MQLSIQLVVQPACVSLQGCYHAALRRQGLLSFRPVMCQCYLLAGLLVAAGPVFKGNGCEIRLLLLCLASPRVLACSFMHVVF